MGSGASQPSFDAAVSEVARGVKDADARREIQRALIAGEVELALRSLPVASLKQVLRLLGCGPGDPRLVGVVERRELSDLAYSLLPQRDAIRCGACGGTFGSGVRYFEVNGRRYHASCLVCAHCDAPLSGREIFSSSGALLCRPCYVEKTCPRCASCGGAIDGRVLQANGKTWHERGCFRCSTCSCELANLAFHVDDVGAARCERCAQLHLAPECDACGKKMPRRHRITARGQRVCESCSKRCARCFSCHRLQTKACAGFADYEDGRVVCGECSRTAVHRATEAREILHMIQSVFIAEHDISSFERLDAFRHLHLVLLDRGAIMDAVRSNDGAVSGCGQRNKSPLGVTLSSVQLQTVDPSCAAMLEADGYRGEDLLRASASVAEAASGLGVRDGYEHGARGATVAAMAEGDGEISRVASVERVRRRRDGSVERRIASVRGIGALKGVPRVHLCAVLAHELCHAFLTLQGFPTDIPAKVEEGLCELWSHLLLTYLVEHENNAEAAFRLELMRDNDDPVYGDGYREALRHFQGDACGRSLVAMLRQLRRTRSLSFPRRRR